MSDEEKLTLVYDKITSKLEDMNAYNWQKLGELFNQQNEIIKRQTSEISDLKLKNKYLLTDNKRRNVVIYGLEEREESSFNLMQTILQLFNLMQSDVKKREIDMCYRLGKPKGKTRPVLIKFCTQWRKQEIFRRRYLLKGKHLYMEHDLSKEEMQYVKEQKVRMQLARDQGKYAVVKGSELLITAKENPEDVQSDSCDEVQITEKKAHPKCKSQNKNTNQNNLDNEDLADENAAKILGKCVTKGRQKKTKTYSKNKRRNRK